MSEIDLIVLGFFMEGPMNAYQLASVITERQVGLFLKISTPAVYKSCKRLLSEGCLDGETVKAGELPAKTIYTLNDQGKQRFYELMVNFSSKFSPYYFDCNAFLFNIEKVEPASGLEMLQALLNELTVLNGWIRQHEAEAAGQLPFAGRAIIKQYRMTLAALLAWCQDIVQEFKQAN